MAADAAAAAATAGSAADRTARVSRSAVKEKKGCDPDDGRTKRCP
jgi:hypothetical protein